MVSRGVYYLVVVLLLITGIALMLYQHIKFEVPWLPTNRTVAWTVEAKIGFDAQPNQNNELTPIKVSLAIPEHQPGFTIVDESAASPDYGFAYVDVNGHSRVEWTKRQAQGPQNLYYRIQMLTDENATATAMTVPTVEPVVIPEPYLTALTQIKDSAFAKSSDEYSYTRELFLALKAQEQNTKLLLNIMSKPEILEKALNLANIPARIVKVIRLEDGRRNQRLIPFIAVFDAHNEYQMFDPETEQVSDNKKFFLWDNNSESILDITGGSNSTVGFSIVRNVLSDNKAFSLKHNAKDSKTQSIFNLSVNALPIEEQAVFKGILLIPLGVFIVVFLRIIVGLKTSGTFMPVLIAMAFLQTSLTVGLIGFLTIVGIGLIIRSWLSYLNLLLVARISTVIITVIGIIGTLSFLTYKVGLTDGIKITFFPMIILSWTIERMSILWEEEGYGEVLKQGSGSLLVAVLAYLAMSSISLQHLTFNFLGLQLVILALVLLMGNYTGYRLSELKRFRPLATEIKDPSGELEADRLKRQSKEL